MQYFIVLINDISSDINIIYFQALVNIVGASLFYNAYLCLLFVELLHNNNQFLFFYHCYIYLCCSHSVFCKIAWLCLYVLLCKF